MNDELDEKALKGAVGGLSYEEGRNKFISTFEKIQKQVQEEQKKQIEKDPDELTEEELDKMAHDYYSGDKDAYRRK